MPIRLLPVVLLLAACASGPPLASPVAAGEFVAPCPSTPNCVSTAAPPDDAAHHAEPFVFTGSVGDAKTRMKALVGTMPRTVLVEETGTSLSFTFTSRLMRFVDDVDMVFVAEGEPGGRIEYRSASRVGRGDLGVNRARMEEIGTAWATASRAR